MSTTVHQSDNMSIIAELFHTEVGTTSATAQKSFFIKLTFIVHVNGKQRIFYHNFQITKDHSAVGATIASSPKLNEEYTLVNWEEWSKVMVTLESMGYCLEGYTLDLPYKSRWKIKDWIKDIMEYEGYKS